MRYLRLLIYNLWVKMKICWGIIVWNLSENIGLILKIFNSFLFTRIPVIYWYWYFRNILNLTYLQTKLFLYIYISETILCLTESNCVLHPFCLILDSVWVLSNRKPSLVWCNNPPEVVKCFGCYVFIV